MAKEKFERNAPGTNMGRITLADQGKRKIGTAIAKHAALKGYGAKNSFDGIDKILGLVFSNRYDMMKELGKLFLMPVGDVSAITGCGIVGICRVEQCIVSADDEENKIVGKTQVGESFGAGVVMFRKLVDEGRASNNVGLVLRGVKRVNEDVRREYNHQC
jgi:translation elongation factor EF-Tu-like GTPase